jgi:iron complex transport system substrate-binding protein
MKFSRSLAIFTAFAALSGAAVLPSISSAGAVSSSNMCIVSLSPSATETLFWIGAGHQVEAVDKDSNYPTSGLPKKRIDPFNPSAEEIATLCKVTKSHPSPKPDLVVISYDANSVAEQLGTLGVDVVTQSAPATLSDAYSQITTLGSLTGHASKAASLVSMLKSKIAHDVASIAAHPKKVLTTYYELDPTLYSLTSSTFVGHLMSLLGVTDIADAVAVVSDGGYPQLSREYLVASNPKLVFLADTKCCSVDYRNFKNRVGFSVISAVKHHHVVGLNDDVASRWGPRLGTLMDNLTAGVKATLNDKSVWTK